MTSYEFRVSNTTTRTIVFCLEPWGGRYGVAGCSALRIVIESPTYPVMEWEFADDVQTLFVHDPPGAVATVYDGENQARAE
jgi:hypothetical protein